MNPLMQVSIFSSEFISLSEFYRDLFDLTEVEDLRSDIFRGYLSGDIMIGFSALAAYDMLGLNRRKNSDGDQTALTFKFTNKEDLDSCIKTALTRGAVLVQAQFTTYYDWYMAVMRDPDGNAIRLACTTP